MNCCSSTWQPTELGGVHDALNARPDPDIDESFSSSVLLAPRGAHKVVVRLCKLERNLELRRSGHVE
jgi:hypothetical protein